MEKNENIIVLRVEDNEKYGLIKSSIIGRISWWCEYNEKNNVKDRFHDKNWWSGYMTYEEFSKQIGIPKKTIEKNIQQLVNDKIIIKGQFNKKGYDNTGWYRVNPQPLDDDTSTLREYTPYSNRVDRLLLESTPSTLREYTPLLPESRPIPVSLTVNQNVSKNVNISGNPEKIKKLEEAMLDWRKKELLSSIEENILDNKISEVLELLVIGASITNREKELVIYNKSQLIEKIPALKEYIFDLV